MRRELPHQGAQLRFEDVSGYRLTAFATNTKVGQLADLEVRHRLRARCQDRIRCAKDTGLDRFPLQGFAQNRIWCLRSWTCPVFCVSVLQVGVDSVGVCGGELGQGLFPVGCDLSFDELALCFALGWWQFFLLVAFSGSFVHGCRRSPATAARATASSEGKWPRFLETLRSW